MKTEEEIRKIFDEELKKFSASEGDSLEETEMKFKVFEEIAKLREKILGDKLIDGEWIINKQEKPDG